MTRHFFPEVLVMFVKDTVNSIWLGKVSNYGSNINMKWKSTLILLAPTNNPYVWQIFANYFLFFEELGVELYDCAIVFNI